MGLRVRQHWVAECEYIEIVKVKPFIKKSSEYERLKEKEGNRMVARAECGNGEGIF